MKTIKLILSLLFVATFSCTEDFEEVNTDPDKATEVPAHLLLGNLILSTQNTIYNAQIGGDMGECWIQHWSKVQYNDEARYIPRRGVIDDIWSTLYAFVIEDAKAMYDLAEIEGNSNLQGIALVMQANAFQLLTELYGPIPFDEAVVEGIAVKQRDRRQRKGRDAAMDLAADQRLSQVRLDQSRAAGRLAVPAKHRGCAATHEPAHVPDDDPRPRRGDASAHEIRRGARARLKMKRTPP